MSNVLTRTVYLDAPSIGEEEKLSVSKAIDSGFISTAGPLVPEFEEKFARWIGARKAVSTQSGTAALHVALYESGIGAGDEVIVPVLTFVATVNPVVYVGAKPVFVDVDPKTWNIDIAVIERKITKRTKAILPVHLFGNPCAMDDICRIARKHKLLVIEDATESLGSVYKGRVTGNWGDWGCFSFNGNKTMTTGGGGMLIGRNQKKLEHAKFLVNQARDESKGYYHPEIGFNYRMTNVEAALGLAQLGKLERFLQQKRDFFAVYRHELKNIHKVVFQEETPGAESARWMTCIRFMEKTDIAAVQAKLRTKGIQTRRLFMPVVEFPPYRSASTKGFKNAYDIYQGGLCLPGSTINSTEDIAYVCRALKESLGINPVPKSSVKGQGAASYKIRRVVLLAKYGKPMVEEVIKLLREKFEECIVHMGNLGDEFPKELMNERPDLLISYISPWVVPQKVLDRTKLWNINFHPGPPEYPGIGCFNFAIYNQEREYGATAHIMERAVDTGTIIAVERFPIEGSMSVHELSIKTYDAMFKMFCRTIQHIAQYGELPSSKEKWQRLPYRRTQLEELCRVEQNMSSDEINRRILATTYPGKPGAYIEAGGRKFELNVNR